MPARDPFKMVNMPGDRLFSLKVTMANSLKRPPIGITQGGSGRRSSVGAKVAATNATVRQPRAQVE